MMEGRTDDIILEIHEDRLVVDGVDFAKIDASKMHSYIVVQASGGVNVYIDGKHIQPKWRKR